MNIQQGKTTGHLFITSKGQGCLLSWLIRFKCFLIQGVLVQCAVCPNKVGPNTVCPNKVDPNTECPNTVSPNKVDSNSTNFIT